MIKKTPPADIKDGLHPNLPFEVYCVLKRVNQSLLSKFALSAAHAREYLTNPSEPTKDQVFGTCGHYAILEPHLFESEVVVCPKFDRRTAAGKEAWKKFQNDNAGKEIVTAEEHKLAKAMGSSVLKHPLARELMKAKGVNEVTACWTDPSLEIPCKGRIDRLTSMYGYTIVLDLKTTRSAKDEDFERSIAKFGYHIQAAFYLDGLNALAKANRRYWILAVEKKPPFACQVFELEDEAIAQGRDEYRSYLRLYRECMNSGYWPGYSTGITPIGLPRRYRSNVAQTVIEEEEEE